VEESGGWGGPPKECGTGGLICRGGGGAPQRVDGLRGFTRKQGPATSAWGGGNGASVGVVSSDIVFFTLMGCVSDFLSFQTVSEVTRFCVYGLEGTIFRPNNWTTSGEYFPAKSKETSSHESRFEKYLKRLFRGPYQ